MVKVRALDELLDLAAAAGVTVIFDSRRYARAARSFPDNLPPMFGPANATDERWGMASFGGMWVPRRPEEWPEPTVRVGELWEQKSALVPTWEIAKSLPADSIYGCTTSRVVRIAGECFLDEHGRRIPWEGIPGPHWRLLEAAAGGGP